MFRNGIENQGFKCGGIKKNLTNLLLVFGLTELSKDSAALYESGFFNLGTAPLVLDALKQLMVTIRPQVIPLVESFHMPDSILQTAIGNSYGDIYETQLEWAKTSRLNDTPVPKGFNETLLPILQGKL